MDIVDLYVMDIILLFLILVCNIYGDVDNWLCGGLLCWSKRVVCMKL